MADFDELRNMVSSFRVSELQVLLGFAGRNKSGRKHELLVRALHLLKSGCSPAVQIKIKELYRRRFPRTIESLADLSALKSPAFPLDATPPADSESGSGTALSSASTSATSQPSSPLVSPLVLHETKPSVEMQEASTSIHPVHPDVQLKSIPFYDVLDVLIKPTSLESSVALTEVIPAACISKCDTEQTDRPTVPSNIQRFQEKYFIFALTPQQVKAICISRDFLPGGRRDYIVQVQLRFCLAETSCPQEDNYPNNLCIKVNGKLYPLPGFTPPLKNGVEQKRPGRPLNITSQVRLSSAVPNQISVSWAPEMGRNYSVSVYLVKQLTSAVLLQRLRNKGIRNPDHSRALIKEKLTADPDSEIATTSLRVSLMCPLGKMRLTVPCRAVTCTHLQCFDAALYLQMNEKKPTWICPVCDKKATYESLIIDGLFMEILNSCTDVDEIKFLENGAWCPMRPKKESLKLSSQCPKVESTTSVSKPGAAAVPASESGGSKKVEVIDLTLDSSSSEEEEEPLPKKRCLFPSKVEESVAGKGVLTYQPSSLRVPPVDSSFLPQLSDYPAAFHHSTMSTLPPEIHNLDFFSLFQNDAQYCQSIFLDNLTSAVSSPSLTPATPTGPIISSSQHHEGSTGRGIETGVITGGGGGAGGGSIAPDIISLD